MGSTKALCQHTWFKQAAVPLQVQVGADLPSCKSMLEQGRQGTRLNISIFALQVDVAQLVLVSCRVQ